MSARFEALKNYAKGLCTVRLRFQRFFSEDDKNLDLRCRPYILRYESKHECLRNRMEGNNEVCVMSIAMI